MYQPDPSHWFHEIPKGSFYGLKDQSHHPNFLALGLAPEFNWDLSLTSNIANTLGKGSKKKEKKSDIYHFGS